MSKVIDFLKKPMKIFIFLNNKKILNFSDEKYLKIRYRISMNKKLNIKEPQDFSEKLQWLKLYDKKEIYVKMVDKYEAKEFVKNIIGKEYIIPTIGIYEKFDDINFEKLPNSFVIKCTHDSGSNIICKDKKKIDVKKVKKNIEKALKRDYFICGREWPYKKVIPRIIIEEYMEDGKNEDLLDYKLFCFNGKFELLLVCSNRSKVLKKTWFDRNFSLMNITEGKHPIDKQILKPKNFEKMIELAEKLSKGIPFLRVDFYEINGNIYFGELTLYPNSGFENFQPEEWNKKLGDKIILPINKGSDYNSEI